MVFEVADRNSGRVQAKFLERAKHKNPVNGQYYQPRDFRIGETIQLLDYRFLVMQADEYTHQYWENYPEQFPNAQINNILKKIVKHGEKVGPKAEFLVEFLARIDPELGRVIPASVIEMALR